jgi:hypothetical protein
MRRSGYEGKGKREPKGDASVCSYALSLFLTLVSKEVLIRNSLIERKGVLDSLNSLIHKHISLRSFN